jgi:hypothetical protein
MRVCDVRTIQRVARFDMKNPLTAAAARDNAARLVTSVTRETKKAITAVIQRSVEEGIPPARAAQMIRPLIGLNDRQAMAVINAQLSWEANGLPPQIAMRKAKAYAEKLLRQRTRMIARTEILRASNAGQRAAWRQARSRGLLPHDQQRVWITTGGACAICSPLGGQTAGLDESFAGGIDSPPAHPHCRCTTGLTNSGSIAAEQNDDAAA